MSALLTPRSSIGITSAQQPLEYSYAFIGHGTQSIDQDDYLIQRSFSAERVKEGGGELMFGGGRSYATHSGVGNFDDSEIDESAANYLRQELKTILKLGNDDTQLQASYEWTGIMGFSRDHFPWVGEINEEVDGSGGEGLWVCGGFSGSGMPNAWLCGKAVVDLILRKDKNDVDLPVEYAVSSERIGRARRLFDEVHIADRNSLSSVPPASENPKSTVT